MKLFFRKYGKGPALVILHGLFGSSDNWVSIAKAVSGHFTVYLPDQRNHGLSPHSLVHDYDSMSSDLLETVDWLGIGRFFLAGHSMGGKTAVGFACRWPERLNGLLVADISPFTAQNGNSEAVSNHLAILKTILSLNPGHFKSRIEADEVISRTIPEERLRGLILKNLQRKDNESYSWKLNASSLLNNFDKILEGVDPGKCGSSPITGFPVFFLHSEKSGYLPKKDFRQIMEIFPATEFISVPGAGHWIQVDNPEAVIKALLGFIDLT